MTNGRLKIRLGALHACCAAGQCVAPGAGPYGLSALCVESQYGQVSLMEAE